MSISSSSVETSSLPRFNFLGGFVVRGGVPGACRFAGRCRSGVLRGCILGVLGILRSFLGSLSAGSGHSRADSRADGLKVSTLMSEVLSLSCSESSSSKVVVPGVS